MKSLKCSLKANLAVLLIVIPSVVMTGQDIEGNPLPHFLFPSFKEGLVIMKDGQKTSATLNYNMVEEMMVTELNGTYRYSKDPELIDTIYLENRVFVPVENKFYEILSGGTVTFFLQNKSLWTPKGTDIGYGATSRTVEPNQYQRFELSDLRYFGEVAYMDLPPNVEITPASVYWVSKNNKMEKFSTKNQFLKLFPEYTHELKTYFKKEKINIKSREDMISLGNYCNDIIKK